MNFLRALFWIVLTIVVVVFSMRNWTVVTVGLFGGLAADVKLPVLLLVAFLIGFVPLYIWYRVHRWRLERRLLVAERALIVPAPVAVPVSVPLADPAPVSPAPFADV